MTRPVHFHIDEVVLRGVRPEDARDVIGALESGLVDHAQMLTTSDDPITPRTEASRRLNDVTVPAGTAFDLGEGLARAVFGTVTGPGCQP